MYKLLYPSIRVRTAPPVSVRVRVRVSFSLCIGYCSACADLCDSGPESNKLMMMSIVTRAPNKQTNRQTLKQIDRLEHSTHADRLCQRG